MFDSKQIDDITQRISAALPSGLREVQDDVEKNLRAALQSALAKLELVTRDEFEVQSAVLQRTREKLEALERRVSELESQIK